LLLFLYCWRIIITNIIISLSLPIPSSYQLHAAARRALVHGVPVLALTLRNVASLAIRGVTARILRNHTSCVWLLT
jgi:hypothetical protein